jgi:hypothetical protein
VRVFERALRIGVTSVLTLLFAAWSVRWFESQLSSIPSIHLPKCTMPPTRACVEHALNVAFSTPVVNHWAPWVVWTIWTLIAVVWLAACALIVRVPRRIKANSDL